MTEKEEQAFLLAHRAVNRAARELYRKEHGDDPAALLAYDELPLLLDENLRTLAHGALAEARSNERWCTSFSPFPSTLWYWGATVTRGGHAFAGTLLDFVKMLESRALVVAAKRSGWVIEPTTNTDGHRTNASTTAMHALFLDCDGAGQWDALVTVLRELRYCFVAYQSGGWSPAVPKWRIVFPLAAPFAVDTDARRAAWKGFYNLARVTCGAVGLLRGAGFDPTVETPCCPWFLTEKRAFEDTPRQVLWQEGHALDPIALILALPEIPVEVKVKREHVHAEDEELSEEERERVIEALCVPMLKIPHTRRDLYLALSGALCDRGAGESTLEIIEEISLRCPGDQDRHDEHVHCANTTVSKWAVGGEYTRIGTLNERWPEVAAALDCVLPDKNNDWLEDAIDEMLRAPTVPPVIVPDAPVQQKPVKPRRIKLDKVGRAAAKLAVRLKKREKFKLSGQLIQLLVDGLPLPHKTVEEADNCIAIVMGTLGRRLPLKTTWQEVLDFSTRSLSMTNIIQSTERVKAAELCFYEGQGKKRKGIKKQQKKTEDEAERLALKQKKFSEREGAI